ncbi:CAD [Symbiodinium microadriaticum]|nr:CAD [Symbiodinium microadriaticum]
MKPSRPEPPFAPPPRPDNDGKVLAGDIDEFNSWEEAMKTPAELRLKSGERWRGFNFGAKRSIAGEVVFCTAMMGYPESLTDPSFEGQILVLTYPIVGNYGVPADDKDEQGIPRYFEGSRIYPVAVVVSEYSFAASHYSAVKSLSQWLEQHNVPGISGVDTRAITKRLRQEGSALGAVVVGSDAAPQWEDPNLKNLVAQVSVSSPTLYQPARDEADEGEPPLVVAVDCGMKLNIVRYFIHYLRVRLKVVPWDYDFSKEEFDGLFISNGPGDPEKCEATVNCLRKVMQERPHLPIFGICLGHQLLSLAAGCKTYKMKFGNRGVNQPCVDLRTGRCYITSQNHGFAVDDSKLPDGWHTLFTNANDGSNEGIGHKEKPWFSVQFHPEACCGPVDTAFLFDDFFKILRNSGGRSLTTISYKHPQAISKVLVLGSGGLTIGQAGEFDYSGSQAIKALREQHVQSVLINPNIATVQTSRGLADQIYFVPVTPEFVTKVIDKVRPDGLFAAFGGQTALNCAVALHRDGTLKKYGVKVLGTQIDSIVATEDREIFKEGVESLGEKCAQSACANTFEEARKVAREIGFPVLVRAAFALGGLGSGFASNEADLEVLLTRAFATSSQVIIDECLKGWKELEYEVVRDSRDNCLVVCNMENLDPMGVHTGESIVVAPSQTLSNDEYHRLRAVAIKVIRHFGIVGEANIQYALDPNSNRYRIVEVNARLSRSSALASKATGYPLAYVAAKLALGHDLVSLRNQVTRSTTACFEPSLDYCVVKIPRWDIDKFPTVERTLGTQMKSVGEVMSIARSFPEAIQKALRMVNEGSVGFDGNWYLRARSSAAVSKDGNIEEELKYPGPLRMWALAHAFEKNYSVEQVYQLTKIDRWFLAKLFSVHQGRRRMEGMGSLDALQQAGPDFLRRVKQLGFCDRQIAKAVGSNAEAVMKLRTGWSIRPCVKQVDTLAAEFPAKTNYLYLSYVGSQHDVPPLKSEKLAPHKDSLYDSAFGRGKLDEESGFDLPTRKLAKTQSSPGGWSPSLMSAQSKEVPPPLDLGADKDEKAAFIVLGSGCYRIGASVEFDWGSVSAVRTLRETGHRAMVINCNPETVSTDYDESDRLYFEELTLETVSEICNFEQPNGTIVSVGGQTPNNLAPQLDKLGIRILGTAAQNIDRAEDRSKFSSMCDELDIDQPQWSEFVQLEDALFFANSVGFPVLVRPSYVLSGAAMRVIDSEEQLKSFLGTSAVVEQEFPVVMSKYIEGAREIEFDGVGCNGEIINYAISEHVEDAGTHSGDATLLLPSQRLYLETNRRVMQIAAQLCKALNISGPFNVQFMSQEAGSRSMRAVKVIECNVRASRTVPFVSKTFNINFIELATRVMLGQDIKPMKVHVNDFDFVACKAPMFSFLRLSGSDPRVGVEMQSTGEVACFGHDAHEAFLKSIIASGIKIKFEPCGLLLSLGPQEDKMTILEHLPLLDEMGYTLYATSGTASFLQAQRPKRKGVDIPITILNNAVSPSEPNVTDAIVEGTVRIVICTPSSRDSGGATAGYFLRRKALESGATLVVNLRQALMLIDALYQKWITERQGTPGEASGAFEPQSRGGFEQSARAASLRPRAPRTRGPALTGRLFRELPISERTLRGLEASKYVKMTEIQSGAIPLALSGRDILGEARTGSGKTLAFLVPAVEYLYRQNWSKMDGLGSVIVSPTRELAYQIFQVLTNVGQEHEISAGCIVGGRSLAEEQHAVANMSILVATPGRLLQHLDESPGFDASALLILVIDEADRILDFGFQETMHNILQHLPVQRQTLLFSATLHNSVHRLGRAALRSPEVISVHHNAKSRTPETLKQIYMVVPLEKKVDTLFSFLRSHSQKKTIVFVSTCKQVRFLYEAFRKLKPGPAVMELHGRQSLTKRMLIFQQFMERERAVALLCTDIAARGVDFPAVDWVVQADCPDTVDSYIHRVGRTARYESTGKSALFLLPSEKPFVDKLLQARVGVRAINAKQSKVVSIQQKLASVLAESGDIRHLAQRAFASYVRSVRLMKDKDIFDFQALPKAAFAESLGLADAPEIGAEGEGEDTEHNKLKKRKNQSALQRLKDKIREKKQAGKQAPKQDEDTEEELELDQPPSSKKKVGKWERRQRRIAAASKAGLEPAKEAATEEDFLELVEAQREGLESQAVLPIKKRLKIRKDGSAQASGQHVFFTGKNGAKASSELAQLADELRAEVSEKGESRASFLRRVQDDLATRDSSDAALSRSRIQKRHQTMRRKERAAKGVQDNEELDCESESPPPSPAPQQTEGSLEDSVPKRKAASSVSKIASLDLEDLEKKALSRLGGLFA